MARQRRLLCDARPVQRFHHRARDQPGFGEILGLWAAVTWDLLGRPKPVLLVEAGPGRGTLMADALRAIAQWRRI